MILSLAELADSTEAIFPAPATPPSVLRLVQPLLRIRKGADALQNAREVRTTASRLRSLAAAADPVAELLGPLSEFTRQVDERVRRTIGQLLIGALAERVFVKLWRSTLPEEELRLRDDRLARGDTDYLVFDDRDRQVFRLNIKFHGSQFRNARVLVDLEPADCFALATYKIHAALVRQDAEHLPYIFVVIGVPGLTGDLVGGLVPDVFVRLLAAVHESRRVVGKRAVEDALVERMVSEPDAFGVADPLRRHLEAIRQAEWRVISARRANELLKENLFERAYALRVRAFARNYPGAELDMHFSVSRDLHPLDDLFSVLREHGMPGLVSRLERGSL